MPKLVAALLAAVLAALALAACGGGDSTTSSSGTATSPSTSEQPSREGTKAKPEQKREEAESEQPKETKSSGSTDDSPSRDAQKAAAAVPPLKVSGGGSVKYRTKGGDNSIQDFGEEGDEAELRQAAETLHGFYVTRAEERWDAACSYLTAQFVKQFEALASRTPELKGGGCGEALQAFIRPVPPSIVQEIARIDAVSLRREGARAFLLYRGNEGTVYAIPMRKEDGVWKVGGLTGTPIS